MYYFLLIFLFPFFFLALIHLTSYSRISFLKVLEVSSIKLTSIALSMARECDKDRGDDEEEEEEVDEHMIDGVQHQNHQQNNSNNNNIH